MVNKSTTDKLFDSENSDVTTMLLRNRVKLVTWLFVVMLLPNTALSYLLVGTLGGYLYIVGGFIDVCMC